MDCNFTPHMTEAEMTLLAEIFPQKAAILEFGCGGSTQFFYEHGAEKIISIDSDKAWLEKLLTNPVISIHHRHGMWQPLHANIGQVGEWGAPHTTTPRTRWLSYHQHCWGLFSKRDFDLVLIDGRFRVACVCQTLLRCNGQDMILAVHDFWHRPGYHVVLDFIDAIHQVDSLGIFKAKASIDWRKLAVILQEYQFVYA